VLDAFNQIWRYAPSAPGTTLGAVGVSGLASGEALVGVDVHPATGQMYGLAVNGGGAGSAARFLAVDPMTGVTAQVGTTIVIAPAASDAGYGIDFNPTVAILRVVNSAGANFRIIPETGAVLSVDPNVVPSGQEIECVAYDRNTSGGGPNDTTAYTISPVTGSLLTLGGINQTPSPNTGTLMNPLPLNTPIDVNTSVALDIFATDEAFAIFDGAPGPPISTGLYRIDLATGTATLVGALGFGPSVRVWGMALR
jgi:hypothetical protein